MQFANKQLDDFSALLFRLLAIALALSIAGLVATYLFGPKIVSFLYTDEYSENNTALLWLVVSAGMGFFSSFFGCALTAARKFGIQAVTNGAMVIVLLLACWMLIPAYDLLGAALASVAGAGTKLILSSIVMIKTIERARGNHD